MLTTEQLYGLTNSHTVLIAGEADTIRLVPTAAEAYLYMQDAAAQVGIHMAIASGFRSFARQRLIWNKKFNGETPLYTIHGDLLNTEQLAVGEIVEAILTWSALPGASRHHWGTDFDLYDPTAFADGQRRLQLVPAEYEDGGPCYNLHQWLQQHARDYGFFFPYARYQGGVAAEPWHLSYAPLALPCQNAIDIDTLKDLLATQTIAGQAYVLDQLTEIKHRYIDTICLPELTVSDTWFG